MPPTHPTRGASLVEFVLVFPVAVLLVLGLVQCGLLGWGKLSLNHLTFMAARHGALHHADEEAITAAVVRGLVPFHQDSRQRNDALRVLEAHARAQHAARAYLQVERVSPNERTFEDFGVERQGRQEIPHDNLRWRQTTVGARSGVHIQDANLLKIKVTYGQELKVPLMGALWRTVLCSGGAAPSLSSDCARYYAFNRVPLVSFAVVEMQSPARAP
ncbi:MAG: TadE/TadG family type IV pilus assembly protein [Pseudomonadota bacterium]